MYLFMLSDRATRYLSTSWSTGVLVSTPNARWSQSTLTAPALPTVVGLNIPLSSIQHLTRTFHIYTQIGLWPWCVFPGPRAQSQLKYGNNKPCQKTFPTAKGSFILSYQFYSFVSTHLHIHSTSVCTLRFGQPPKDAQANGEQVPKEWHAQTNGKLWNIQTYDSTGGE